MSVSKKLILIGGGAAGFFCAVNAARMNPQLKVIILEKSSKVLSKVRVSGGGRCNVTHACFEIAELIKSYPRGENFLKKAFHWFNTSDTVQWFQDRGVNLKKESDGRMFPISDSSQTIIDCLLQEANRFNVEIYKNSGVEDIEIFQEIENQKFRINISNQPPIDCDFVCVAAGGYAKSNQFNWLQSLGHSVISPVPSLFTFNLPLNNITALQGISVPDVTVRIQASKFKETGPMLITHWGLSGPAVLRLSAKAARLLAEDNYHFNILVNWLGDCTEQHLRNSWHSIRLKNSSQHIGNKNAFGLPARLWLYLLEENKIDPETRWAALLSGEQNKLIQNLVSQSFEVKGKTTFKEEFVTCGGIKLSEIDSNTMQSKIIPCLYFAGEVIDIDGITGGFNFQNAWTSGYIAAKDISAFF